MPNLEQIGLDAVDKFIDTWNSRDPVAWADSLNFPHVRPAPRGPIEIAPDAETYISRVDFDRVVATGWDHSEWDYKHVLHVSPSKIHVAGQWGRYNKDGERILTNPVVYIVTNADGWGVQSRFSADDPGDEDTTGLETRAFKLIETWANQLSAGRRESCAELLNYPFFEIEVGDIKETTIGGAYVLPAQSVTIESMMAIQTGRISMNVAAELSIDHGNGERLMQAVINLTMRDDHLGIQAMSLVDPAETEE